MDLSARVAYPHGQLASTKALVTGMSDHPPPSPFNPLPPVVAALALVIFGIEVIFTAGAQGLIGGPDAIGWRQMAVEEFGFFTVLFQMALGDGPAPSGLVVRFFSYPFVHLSFTQMLFVVVFLLALGNIVGRVFSPLALIGLFFGSAAGGALLYAVALDDPFPLVGGFPAVYGLIGAYSFILWLSFGAVGENQYRAFTLIGMLMGIQLLFAVLFGTGNDWVADIGGFATGFALSFVLSPGGWGRLLQRIRRR